MKTIKKTLFFLISLVAAHCLYGQAPAISYSAATSKLTVGSAYSFSPVNTGGAVPANNYGQVTTFAGSTTEVAGYVNDTGTNALFNFPQQMVMDASGNLYVADATNNCIREITPAGVVTTFAGSLTGANGFTDATGTSAQFDYPDGLTIDASGNLYVADYNNNAIRKITSSGVVSTFYNSSGTTFGPGGLCFDHSGNLLVTAQDASQIISIDASGTATLIAGSTPGYTNGAAASAQFNTPTDVRVDAAGNIYVVDFENNAIRKITAAGTVSTFAGSSVNGNTPGYANGVGTTAVFNNPAGLVIAPGGVIYVADLYNNDIRRIMPDGTVTLLAGSNTQVSGDADGTGTGAGFNLPDYMYIDGTGNGYIAEFAANRIRKILLTGYTLQGTLPAGLIFSPTTGVISGTPTAALTAPLTDTVTAWNGAGYSAAIVRFNTIILPPIISYDISTDTVASGVPYTLNPTNSGGAVPAGNYAQVSTFAGSTSDASGYTNATGTSAAFHNPSAGVTDAAGNLYVADAANNAIRKVDPTGVVTTFAGSATGASGSADATGTAATFNNPRGLAMDASGNLIVADYGNNSIRKIDTTGAVTTFYHSTGTFGPAGLTVDASANIIVAAMDLHQVLKITPAAAVSTVAGSTAGYTNATGTAAQFSSPADVKMDASANLFVADYTNNAIRKIDPSGVVTTFAGSDVNGNTGSFLDGTGTAARFNHPAGLAIAPGGVIYVADLSNNDIRSILPDATVSLVAGSASQAAGNNDAAGTSASFSQPAGIYVNNNASGYVMDAGGNNVRKLTLTGFSLAGVLPSGLTLSPSTGSISGTVSGTVTPAQVTITAFNAGGFSLITPLLGSTTNDWKGTTSTAWATGSNWSKGTAPATTDIARIGVSVAYTNQPILAASTTIATLAFGTMAPGSAPVLTINSGATLTTTSGVTVANSTSATINGPGGLKLTSNSSLTSSSQSLTAALNLVITLNANTFFANTSGGTFTLASDANGCASIAPIPSSSGVNGQVSVQRYITGGSGYRGYRDLSSPVYASNTGSANVYSILYTHNTSNSTFLTGLTGASGGFDQTGNPTLYLFREDVATCNSSFDCGNYQGIYDLTSSPSYKIDPELTNYYIPTGTGFLCFFRGGQQTTSLTPPNPYSTSTIPGAATFIATGTLNQGHITVQDWYNPGSTSLSYTTTVANSSVRGEQLVGNPYPSSIDWNTFNTSSMTTGIYGASINNFIYELTSSGTYSIYDEGSTPTNGASNIIQSGAAFYVTASGPGASLIFNESAKVPAQLVSGGGGVEMALRQKNQANKQYLRLEMNKDTLNREDAVVWFSNSNKVSFEPGIDAPYKLGYNSVSLSSLSTDQVQLGINKQPFPGNERRIIGINADAVNSGVYHLNLIELVGIPKLYDVLLMDNFKKDSVSLVATKSYDFSIDKKDSATFGSKRFSLVIKQNPVYAYRLLNFTASRLPSVKQVNLAWTTKNEEDYTNFTIERSTDGGNTFEALGSIKASGQGQYTWLDKAPVTGTNLYHLKQVELNNTITYSAVVAVSYSNTNTLLAGAVTVFPNPATSNISINIASDKLIYTGYMIRVSDATGVVVKQVAVSGNSWQGNVSGLLPGTYVVRVVDNKTQGFIGNGKFIKL